MLRFTFLILDPLIILAGLEQLFWEGDSLTFLKSALIACWLRTVLVLSKRFLVDQGEIERLDFPKLLSLAAAGIFSILPVVHSGPWPLLGSALALIPFYLLESSEDRYRISLPCILLGTFMLAFEILVALDVSLYRRLEGLITGPALGLPEAIALLSMVLLFFHLRKNARRELTPETLVALAGLLCGFAAVFFTALSYISRFGVAVDKHYPSQTLLAAALLLFLGRVVLFGERVIFPLKAHVFLAKLQCAFVALLIGGGLTLTGYCSYLARTPLPVSANSNYKVSKIFLVRLLVTEDPLFLSNFGVDFKRIRDVVRETIERQEFRRGASSIAMQLAKVQYLTFEQTISRKLEQLIIGLMLEARYSKNEILESYLEQIAFAPEVKGLTAAAAKFYGSDPTSLSPEQALSLVLTIFDPASYNPGMSADTPRIVVRTALVNNRVRRYNGVLWNDLSGLKVASENSGGLHH